jgi:hypothetical protein
MEHKLAGCSMVVFSINNSSIFLSEDFVCVVCHFGTTYLSYLFTLNVCGILEIWTDERI